MSSHWHLRGFLCSDTSFHAVLRCFGNKQCIRSLKGRECEHLRHLHTDSTCAPVSEGYTISCESKSPRMGHKVYAAPGMCNQIYLQDNQFASTARQSGQGKKSCDNHS